MFGLRRRQPRPPEPDPRLEIALAQALRALDGQSDNLDNLRSRVGILLSAATLATSFLGGIALEAQPVGAFAIAAVVLFVIHVGIDLWILWPRGWKFQAGAQHIIERWIDDKNASEDRVRRALAIWADKHHDRQTERLDWLWIGYSVAILALGLEIVAWLAELGGFQGWLCGATGLLCS